MAASITCRSIRRVDGKIYVRWSDKSEWEFESLAQMRRELRNMLDDGAVQDVLKSILLAKPLAANPDGSTLANAVNRTATIDLSLAANLVRQT